jgi:curli biogenesis system outer membrane secretion channel CsgG
MKYLAVVLVAGAATALGACTTINTSAPAGNTSAPAGNTSAPASRSPSSASPASPAVSAVSAQPAPTVTKTVIKHPRRPAATTPQTNQAPQPAETAPSAVPNVTDPWAVVSGYYGDIESGNYQEAWTLLSSGMVTGQTYQQFVSGFSCTGAQRLTELGESGNTVRFSLAATDICTGRVQHFTGSDTVANGKIVAADVTRSG